MEQITFTTQITEEEFVAVGWHITLRYMLRTFAIWAALLLLLSIGNDLYLGNHKDAQYFIILACVVGLIIPYFRMRIRGRLRKTYRESFRLHSPITYKLDDQKCVQSGESFRLDIPWDKIISVELWRGAYLLYPNKRLAHLIPANALDPENERIFQDILDRVKPGWRK